MEPGFMQDKNGVLVWNPGPLEDESCLWSGESAGGFAEGEGTLVWYLHDREISRYQGGMKKGKCHGYGRYAFHDGDVYEGEWAEGLREGHGRHSFRDGRIYEGQWKGDRRTEGL